MSGSCFLSVWQAFHPVSGVRQPLGKPVLSQQMRIPSVEITKIDDGVKIARMVLSSKPYVADESEALRNMLMGLGTM